MSFFSDYDMRYFIEHHAARCPATGEPARLVSVSEDDAGFNPLSPAKEWQPASCPGYRPPQKPTWIRYVDNLPQRLIGIWTTNNFGGHSDESLVIFPDGTGLIEFWNITFCGHRKFHWKLEKNDHLRFGTPHDQPTEHGDSSDGAASYLGSHHTYFELLLFTNSYGEENDQLCIYPDGIDGEPREFIRSRRSLVNYQLPSENGWS